MKHTFFCTVFLCLLTACQSTDSAQNISDPNTSPVVTASINESWIDDYINLMNDHRISLGLRPLSFDEGLNNLTQVHSNDMATGITQFGHTGFSARCSQAYSLLNGGNWCGENVAMGQISPEAVFTAWMNSSAHRANIEKDWATHTGLGYAKSVYGVYYWTQIFIEKD